MLTARWTWFVVGVSIALSACAPMPLDGRTCGMGENQAIVYDGLYRIDVRVPERMELLLIKRNPTVLDIATKKGSGSKQNTLIVMLGADLDKSLHRYAVDIVLEYSTDLERRSPPKLERIVEHNRSRTGPDIPWIVAAFGGLDWVHSDRRALDFELRSIEGDGFTFRDSSEVFLRPIDADVDIRVLAEYRLKRDKRPEDWLEARSACTRAIVSSIKISQIDSK